jgi:hypothetical protein
MPQIIAALFDDQGRAERALQALVEAGLGAERITLVGDTRGREVSSISGFRELSARDDDLAALDDLELPPEDIALFRSGLARGHVLVAARVDRTELERGIEVLDLFDPVDLDHRSEAGMRESGAAGGSGPGAPLGAGLTAGADAGQTNTPAVPGMGTLTDATDDLGSADLRTGEGLRSGLGAASTAPAGGRRPETRAGEPGVLETSPGVDAARAAKTAPALDRATTMHGNAKPELFRRDTSRIGRVRAYSRDV